jgi:hypothetical protein
VRYGVSTPNDPCQRLDAIGLQYYHEQLYIEISSKLEQFHARFHRRRLANWVWVIVGMVLAKSVQLSAIANHIPDSTEATARIAKVRRWLKNPHIDTQALYQPIIQYAHWSLLPVIVLKLM